MREAANTHLIHYVNESSQWNAILIAICLAV